MAFRRHLRLVPGVVCALAAWALIGCGGSSSLSDQQLVAKADALCTKLRASAPSPPTSVDPGALTSYADQAQGPAQQALQGFRGLKPPSSKSSIYRQFVDAAARRTADIQALGVAAKAHNASQVQAVVVKAAQDALPYRQAAQQLGFRVCGSGGATAAKPK